MQLVFAMIVEQYRLARSWIGRHLIGVPLLDAFRANGGTGGTRLSGARDHASRRGGLLLALICLTAVAVRGAAADEPAFPSHVHQEVALGHGVRAVVDYDAAPDKGPSLSHFSLTFIDRRFGGSYTIRPTIPAFTGDVRLTPGRVGLDGRMDVLVSYFGVSGPGIPRFSAVSENTLLVDAPNAPYHVSPCHLPIADALVAADDGTQGLLVHYPTRVYRLRQCAAVPATVRFARAIRYEAESILAATGGSSWPPADRPYYHFIPSPEFGDDVDAIRTLSVRYMEDAIALGDDQIAWARFERSMAAHGVRWNAANFLVGQQGMGQWSMYGLIAGSQVYYEREVRRIEHSYGNDSPLLAMPLVRLERLAISLNEDDDLTVRGPINDAEPWVQRATELIVSGHYPADACPLGVLLDDELTEDLLGKTDIDERRYLAMQPYLKLTRGCPPNHLITRLISAGDFRRTYGDFEQSQTFLRLALSLPQIGGYKTNFGTGDIYDPASELAEDDRLEGRPDDAVRVISERLRVAPAAERPLLDAQLTDIAAHDVGLNRGMAILTAMSDAASIDERAQSAGRNPYDALSMARVLEVVRRYARVHPQNVPAQATEAVAKGLELDWYADAIGALQESDYQWDPESVPIRIEAGTASCAYGKYNAGLAILAKAKKAPAITPIERVNLDLAEATCLAGEHRTADALRAFSALTTVIFANADHTFRFMPEATRLSYIAAARNAFGAFYSFAVDERDDPAVRRQMMDVVLSEKGLVLGGIAQTRAVLHARHDSSAETAFETLARDQNALDASRLAGAGPSMVDEEKRASSEIERLEAMLLRKEAEVGVPAHRQITTHDVASHLGAHDAAVEIVRYPVVSAGAPTETFAYAAVVVDSSDAPHVVALGDASQLEATVARAYAAAVDPKLAQVQDPRLYDALWRPIDVILTGATRVFFSPDGIYSQISLDIVQAPTGKDLFDTYDLRVMTSTRTLALPQPQLTGKSAVLFGDPAFAADLAPVGTGANDRSTVAAELPFDTMTSVKMLARGLRRGGTIEPLSATADEVHGVAAVLRSNGWAADDSFTGVRAREEYLAALHGPLVLHMATHGFFFPPAPPGDAPDHVLAADDPMMRSGLLFAGAEHAWDAEQTPPGVEDGILTAKEAATLDLHGTELVVLSACETGLGDVQDGEGVFGLQRALQEAGARNVLMSMWQVDDASTKELMIRFYTYWIANGEEEHMALRHAERDVRAQIIKETGRDLPYYWAAFVLAS